MHFNSHFLFDFLFVLVSNPPLPHPPPVDPPSLERPPSFKNSNQSASPTSPPLPKKDIVDQGSLQEPCESPPLSPVKSEGDTVGEAQDGPIKPKRTAPPPPPTGKLVYTVCVCMERHCTIVSAQLTL